MRSCLSLLCFLLLLGGVPRLKALDCGPGDLCQVSEAQDSSETSADDVPELEVFYPPVTPVLVARGRCHSPFTHQISFIHRYTPKYHIPPDR